LAADDSDLLPKPPPPRPARRDAAIEAALRRFDGADEPSTSTGSAGKGSRPAWWAWSRHPQFGLALTASLVAVIGLPAAFIAIRDQGPTQSEVPAPSATQRAAAPCATPDCAARNAVIVEPLTQKPIDQLAQASSAGPAVQAEAKERPVAEADDVTNALPAPAPPPAMAAAAPPPPPPPAAPMFAQKSAEEGVANGVVVTGSRIAQSNLAAKTDSLDREASRAAGRAEATDARTAPDWVLKDRAYAAFLTQLQTAVRKNDRCAVVGLIAFPLRVNSGAKSRLYRDASSVRAGYDNIFTPKVTRAILGQRLDRLFGRDLGLMIGNGEVWFDHVCTNDKCSPPGSVRISAVNR
jgi:hypothetical protein